MDVMKDLRGELHKLSFIRWIYDVPVRQVKHAVTNKHIIRVGTGIYATSMRMRNALWPRSTTQDTTAEHTSTLSPPSIEARVHLRGLIARNLMRVRAHNGEEQPTPFDQAVRVANITPSLKCLQSTRFSGLHTAPVRCLMFSPNGKYLATCSWDRTCLIFRVKVRSVEKKISSTN